MLTVIFGRHYKLVKEHPDAICNVKRVLSERMDSSWFDDPWVKKQMHDIDGLDVPPDMNGLTYLLTVAHVLPTNMSNGLKNLILAKYVQDRHVMMQMMGPNCYYPLMSLSNQQDILVYSSIILDLDDKYWDATHATIYAPQYGLYARNIDDAIRLDIAVREHDDFGF